MVVEKVISTFELHGDIVALLQPVHQRAGEVHA